MKRTLMVVVMLLLVGGIVLLARALLDDPIGDLIEPTRDDPTPSAAPEDGPIVVERGPESGPARPTGRPWPFAEFEADILALRREDPPPEFVDTNTLEGATMEGLDKHRFDIKMENAEFKEVLDFLTAQLAPYDVAVYTREPVFSEIVQYNLDMRDVRATDVVAEMYRQSHERLWWHISELGFCVGSWAACEKDKEERDLTVARRRAKYDAKTPLLQVEYRPDFVGAHIGDIVRDIQEKTGVQIIVDREAWELHSPITWRTGPRSLAFVAQELAKATATAVRVKDGRAFLISP